MTSVAQRALARRRAIIVVAALPWLLLLTPRVRTQDDSCPSGSCCDVSASITRTAVEEYTASHLSQPATETTPGRTKEPAKTAETRQAAN